MRAEAYIRLTNDEELDLLVRAKFGDARSARRLIDSVTPFIRGTARTYAKRRDYLVEDLIHDAILGCYRAIELVDLHQNVRFLTFACHHIFLRMQTCVVRDATPLSSAMSARERLRRARLGKHDSTAGARFTAVLAETAFHAKSLDEPVNKYSDHVMAVGDMIADDKPGQDKDLELVELASWVRDVLDTMPLSDIERAIVDLHLMRGYSLVEVGKRVNRSRERIRQIKELLMPKLAARFASEPEALHLAF